MSTTLPADYQTAAMPESLQVHLSPRGIHYPALPELDNEQPKVSIIGDTTLCVTELEAALSPVAAHYSIEAMGMQAPLHTLWYAEGRVLYRDTRVTRILFDLHGAQAGEIRTFLVGVQVTESSERRSIVSGVFVQVFVTENVSGSRERRER